ncbi:DUF6931 family protein [Paraburkholderia rhizosphaerae]|uniref:Uncharacterized protein n=1 Tax=Paraburkholderia rhizosphaerae TaxID=480658 RepID=A0A4R8M065_9BURK|nr:hypothetical protein [Paraburkholderia rhizosphaerae]TDY52754.1 hypothetical protein BX592_10436 [Paraburkholderia rhizosphaerae]
MLPVLEAARQMQLSAHAQHQLDAAMAPRAAVQTLLDAGLAADALSLLARLLPRRYAVAWVCQCARREALDEHDVAGLALAQAWVREPSERNRADAAAFAKTHRYKTIGAWSAAAAGWTGGNLNPQHEQPTPAPEHLTALAAMAAVTYMAARVADQFAARRAGFVRDALGLLDTPTVSTEKRNEQ